MLVTKETKIEDLLALHPQAAKVFLESGLPCLVCGEPNWGTIDELAKRYNKDVAGLLKRLNSEIENI